MKTHCVQIPDITQPVTSVRRRWISCYFGTQSECASWIEESHQGDQRIAGMYRVRRLTAKEIAGAR